MLDEQREGEYYEDIKIIVEYMVKENFGIHDFGDPSTPNMFENEEQALKIIEQRFLLAQAENPSLTVHDFMTHNYNIKKSMHDDQKSWIIKANVVLSSKYHS